MAKFDIDPIVVVFVVVVIVIVIEDHGGHNGVERNEISIPMIKTSSN